MWCVALYRSYPTKKFKPNVLGNISQLYNVRLLHHLSSWLIHIRMRNHKEQPGNIIEVQLPSASAKTQSQLTKLPSCQDKVGKGAARMEWLMVIYRALLVIIGLGPS